MAATVVDRAFRASSPDTVEEDLAALWRQISSHGTVARAVMSNLIVFRMSERREPSRAPATSAPAAVLESVVALHPSRVIVLVHDREARDSSTPIDASVSVCVFGPDAARYGVEQVSIRSVYAEESLPSIVRRFVRGDVPTSVWWTEDAAIEPPLPSLVAMGRQLVYDSRCWRGTRAAVRGLASAIADEHTDLADLNWRRLTPLRRALVHAAQDTRERVACTGMQINHRPEDETLAWLLAAWIAARLRLSKDAWPTLGTLSPDEIAAGEQLTVTVGGRDGALRAAMSAHRVELNVRGRPPLVMAVPNENVPVAIAAELRSLSQDSGLRDAMQALAAYMAD